MQNTTNQNKMAVIPVNKLLLSMGLPIIISMVLQALYNIVDSAFVANMKSNGEAALNALTLAFPMQMFIVAIGIGTGVGANALLARCLGQGDRLGANQTAGNSIFLGGVIYIVFLLFGIFGVKYYIESQSSNPLIIEMGIKYLRICCTLSFGIVFFSVFEKLLQASGHPLCSTIAQISGAVANIILDPIMIYGLFGCPEMGVAGAAYATVIGQWLSAALGLIFHLKFNTEISKKLKYIKPSLKTIRGIYSIGLPAIIAQALMSVMTYGLNIILGSVSEAMVTAYGLYYKLQQFVLFAAFGLRDAITPIVAFGFGMKNRGRVINGMKFGIMYSLIIMVIGTLAAEIFAVPFSQSFGLSGETMSLCVSAMHIISVCFVFAGVSIALQGIFQALDGGVETLIIALGRQFIFILPIAYLLAAAVRSYGAPESVIWVTFPFGELITMLIACAMMKHKYKKISF